MKSKLKNINSNTGKFIDGNPTSGELGTIVTAEWLNGLQERVQDTFDELKNVLALANLQPDGNKTTQVAEAIRAYVQTFNLKIESNTRSLANVIPNSKKSNAVNSNSADTVATSVAVKTAYDKAAEAQSTADGKVSKEGDEMSGALTVPLLRTKTPNWKHMDAILPDGSMWQWEYNPNSSTDPRINLSHRNDSRTVYIRFPTVQGNQYVAYQSWVQRNAIKKDGNNHDIGISWTADGLMGRADETSLGAFVFHPQLNEMLAKKANEEETKEELEKKANKEEIDANINFMRIRGVLTIAGSGTAGGSGQSIYNSFPISFPSQCVAVVPVHIGTDPVTNIIIEQGSITNSGFRAKTNHGNHSAIIYLAFGY